MNIKIIVLVIAGLIFLNQSHAEEYQRDFDHQVQYSLNKMDASNFLLTVYRQNDATFEKMSVFVVRKALAICKTVGYQVTYLAGIENVDDRTIMANKIFSPLEVKVTCP